MTIYLYKIESQEIQKHHLCAIYNQWVAGSTPVTSSKKNLRYTDRFRVISWVFLRYKGLKWAGKCDKNVTNSKKLEKMGQSVQLNEDSALYQINVFLAAENSAMRPAG